jgi:hypothetical protein
LPDKTAMNGNTRPEQHSLLPHFILLVIAGALAGMVSQLSSWQALTGIDPSYLPFIVLVAAGAVIGAIAPLGTAALAGLLTGMAVAGGGLIFHAFTHGATRDSWPTVVSYVAIMACLGAFGGFVGAIPVRLLRVWLKRDPGRGKAVS